MSNNAILYNAALAGAVGGTHERWLVGTDQSAYIAARNAAVSFAAAVDAAIPANDGYTQPSADVLQAICTGVLSNRYLGASQDTSALAAGVAALFNVITPQMQQVPSPYATQAAWVVDPVTGNDNAQGSAAAPLATVTELNRRLSNNRISQNTTVSLVGNQAAALNLANTRIADGVTLTISGTVTNEATGCTISSVTPLGGVGTIAPWTLVTTGVNWSTAVGRRIQISNGASVGAVAWVLAVVDANTVTIGGLGALTTTTIIPTTAMTFNVQTVSTIPASQFLIATGAQLPATLQSLIVRDLAFQCGNGFGDFNFSGPRITLFGCELSFSTGNASLVNSAASLAIRACKFSSSGVYDLYIAAQTTIISSVFVCTNNALLRVKGGNNIFNMNTCAFNGGFFNAQCNTRHQGSLWFQNVNTTSTAGCVLVAANCVHLAFSSSSYTEGTGITGAGICVESGGQFQYLAAVKPTITGSISDTRIGGTIRAYSAVPMVEATNNAMMVEIKN